MKNSKLISSAKFMDTIAKIIQILLMVGVWICGVTAVLLLAAYFLMPDALSSVITVAGEPLDANTYGSLVTTLIYALVFACVLGGLAVLLYWYVAKIIREILAPMKEGLPFIEGVSKKIRKLGWVVLISGIAASLIGPITGGVMTSMINQIPEIAGTANNSTYTMNMNFIFTSLIIFFLSYVFAYGEELQKEADETL
ncbi:MAG: hypothetical protein Q4D13_03540 [Erysipelotrichaceae bacterium]|nr:hypothetical protein [Erysipelotrichaceae bacterium]